MAKPRVDAAGGFPAILYSLRKGREAGGMLRFYRRMRTRNACKTCAFGMGGQQGGMVNEAKQFPEVCKKSLQAQAGDMQPPIDEGFFAQHSIEELSGWSSRQLEYAGRLAFPVAWTEGERHFRRIGWDEALDRVAQSLGESRPEETFFYASGRSSNEAAFLLQVLARLYGTRNVHNCSCYCHQASGVALSRMIGSSTATVVLDDIDVADVAVVVGANPASNHPRLIVKLVELRKRGGKVIVINPVRELGLERFRIPSRVGSLLSGSQVSDIYLQPHVGSDIALLKALLKALIERGGVDTDFTQRHVEGWETVTADALAQDWETLTAACGIDRSTIETTADLLGSARNGMLLWAMGLTHHQHGVDNILALGNLALARGWLGRPHCGLMPIRGHSNVQGVGSVGFTPALKEAFLEKMEQAYGVRPDGRAGLDTYASMEAAREGKIRAAVLMGGNLYASNPDLEWAGEAMRQIDLTAYLSTKLNQGHIHGRGRFNVILPVLARDEERQSTTQESMFNFVRLSDGGEPAPSGALKSEVEIVCSLASRLLPSGPFPFSEMTDHETIRSAIAQLVPGYEPIATIGSSKQEFQIPGRTFHQPSFNTPSGKALAQAPPTTVFEVPEGAYRMMTLRSEGQFNTVVYEEEDLYRGNAHRNVVMMNAADGAALGLSEGDTVTVENELGSMQVQAAFIDIPQGDLAMYYPEANVLVPRTIDPASGTPAFKSIAVRLSR